MKSAGKFFSAALLCISAIGSAHAESLHINIPDSSGMHLYSPDDYTGLVSFSGQVQLQGQLLLASQRKIVDDEPEWQVTFLFQPDLAERDKLPQVRFSNEPTEQGIPWIELNYFQKEQRQREIEAIFGIELASNLGKKVFALGKRGTLALTSFRTGIECDRRYYYADIVSFEKKREMQTAQVRKLSKQIPSFCS